MIYTEHQLIEMIIEMIDNFENEVVEFKEAKTNYSFKDIGKYFSALGNEANIRGKKEGWLVFGVANNKDIVGTAYRNDGGLQNLKKEIVGGTNERLSFMEIYELKIDDKRIIAFQIPPAFRGIPTTWQGAAYAREDENLCPLPMDKVDLIRSQIGFDWSKEIVPDARLKDLDKDAVKYARNLFIKKQQKQNAEKRTSEMFERMGDAEILNKAGILINGQVTNTALILLGKPESMHYFDGFIPRITWTLYSGDGKPKAYEHFDMPLLLAVDKVYAKIRNEKYRYLPGQQSLFPDEVYQYEPDVLKEVLNNCIAHSNYQLRGKINVEEFEDRLVFINEGNFIPETIERTLEEGYKPPYYRNTFLCHAMVNLYMIDTNSMGIPMMYQIQRDKCFPLPSYDLTDINRVKVTLYGKILDRNYTELLHANGKLDFRKVFLLDLVQKKETISKTDYLMLKKEKLVEGRYPHIYVSYNVANLVGHKEDYVLNRGLKNDVYRQMILNALETMGEATVLELRTVLIGTFPSHMDEKQQSRKVSNILQVMKKDGIVEVKGTAHSARWKKIN